MQILHLGKFYPPEFGGIESVTEALATDHARAGHAVRVLCFSRAGSGVEVDENLTVHRHRAAVEVSSQPLSFRYLFDAIRRARNADIVHVHTPNLLAALAVILAGRGPRVVVHWHADIEGKGLLGRLIRPLESLMLKRADAIVATSHEYAQASRALRAHASKLTVIPIGIADTEAPTNSPDILPDQVLFVGRLVPYKGVAVLLRALSQMKFPARLVIVGTGPQESSLKALADSLGVAEHVDFLGKVETSTLSELFRVSTVFCLPSINRLEAFGVVLLEAMRAGCPAVSSDIPGSGVSWVNRDGLQVPVGDHQALASKLDELLDDPTLRRRLSENARARFEKEFERRSMSDRFLSLYESLRH